MKKRWLKLSAKDRLRVLLVSGFMFLGLYGGLLYPLSYDQLTESENMLNRRRDRIAKRTVITTAAVEVNPRVLAEKIEQVEKDFERLSSEIHELEAGFAPITSGEERQHLLLEISNLVRKSGMELLSIAGKGAPLNKMETTTVVDRYLKRPLLKLSARCDYYQLLGFLDGLQDLSNNVAVMQIKLQIEDKKKKDSKQREEESSGLFQVFVMLAI